MLEKQFVSVAAIAVLTTGVALAAVQQGKVMYKQTDGTYVVSTTDLCSNVERFKDTTPVEAYIKSNKVIEIGALPNHEGSKFYDKVKQGLSLMFNGMKISKVAKVEGSDGVAGATYTPRTVKENIATAVAYYKKDK